MAKWVYISGLLLFAGCKYDNVEDLVLRSRKALPCNGIKHIPMRTTAKVETGILWALSYLGAELPAGSRGQTINWTSSNRFTLNLARSRVSS